MSEKIIKLNSEVVILEELSMNLGETKDTLVIKKFKSVSNYMPENMLPSDEEIIHFYYEHIRLLYDLYLDKLHDRNERVINTCRKADYKYYNKWRGLE